MKIREFSMRKCAFVLAGMFILINAGAVAQAATSLLTVLGESPRVIIFSPHPDDDVLGASAVMRAVNALKAAGHDAQLKVVYMTCGDAYDLALEKTRAKGQAQTYFE